MNQSDPFSDFLYPFLENKSQGSLAAVLSQVSESTRQKSREIATLRRAFIDEAAGQMAAAAAAMAGAFGLGGQLLTMGNGGSATDAQDMAADFLHPPTGSRPLPALSLVGDIGIVTAVGNDVGFDNIFSRQVIAYGQAGDMLIGFSTSGQSPNLLSAFEQARRMEILTIGIAGYGGGKMADLGLDFCFVVQSTYVPRIQEVQATIYHTLWHLVQEALAQS